MNLKQLEESGYIIFKAISGSRAYNTHTEESDEDIRGIFKVPNDFWLSITNVIPQINDDTNDIIFYELKRFFELASKCNPNIIELLFLPEDCIKKSSPIMKRLIEKRDLFISKKAYETFSQYAFGQLKRAKGQNKWINNPQSKEPPNKLDFCRIIPVDQFDDFENNILGQIEEEDNQPFRPSLLNDLPFYKDLSEFHVAKLEHVDNAYRLYEYGHKAKGVFRGKDQQLVVESIPIEDEWKCFAGILIFNEQSYDKAKKDWKNYWDWMKNRNEARYKNQESGKTDYDSKNVSHCVRLLWSGKNILQHGKPIIRFDGDKLKMLKDIRNGKYSYEELMKLVEEEMRNLEEVNNFSKIQESINESLINDLYKELINIE